MRTLLALLLAPLAALAAEPKVILEEKFDQELSKDWFWGLGTWNAKDGVLRGFESGARRHGPVKVHRLPLKDGIVEADFRLIGKASFAGIIFNGSQEIGFVVGESIGRSRQAQGFGSEAANALSVHRQLRSTCSRHDVVALGLECH